MHIRQYDSKKLNARLTDIAKKYPDDANLKECGEMLRRAIKRSKKANHIDYRAIANWLNAKISLSEGTEKNIYLEVGHALKESLTLEEKTFRILYSETFEDTYEIKATSYEEAVKILRQRLNEDVLAHPSVISRTEAYLSGGGA